MQNYRVHIVIIVFIFLGSGHVLKFSILTHYIEMSIRLALFKSSHITWWSLCHHER
jgi:hypothetical protein